MAMMGSSELSDNDQHIHDLVLKLQVLLPHLNQTQHRSKFSASASEVVLKETCNYVKKLQSEVDDLSERLWNLLDTMTVDFDIVKLKALLG